VDETKAKYGVHDEDMHNFDETGFQMGVIGSMKVVIGSERRSRPDLIQPGDCKWVTVIQSICSDGSCTPPFIIYKQMAVITKQKTRKRKRLQHGGTLEYGEAADQVAASTALVANPPKKTCSGGAAEGAIMTQRRCSNCGGIGHNARTCQAGAVDDSESSASTQFILSDSGGNDKDD
jgi:hypothetical protein